MCLKLTDRTMQSVHFSHLKRWCIQITHFVNQMTKVFACTTVSLFFTDSTTEPKLMTVTDPAGCTRLSMSLRQVEYLQYYIHEMRLADPVWVGHITKATEGSVDMPDEKVGPAEYPPGEEWVPLPDVFVHGKDIAKVVRQPEAYMQVG
jgi:hypothetical protein